MKKILLAEDDKLIREMVKLNLELEGYNVTLAVDGNQSLELWQKDQYDLILLDVMMPYKDGMSIIKEIRAQKDKTPILLLTSLSETESKVKGLDLGADDYLTKPFDLEELFARVRALIRRRKERKTNEKN